MHITLIPTIVMQGSVMWSRSHSYSHLISDVNKYDPTVYFPACHFFSNFQNNENVECIIEQVLDVIICSNSTKSEIKKNERMKKVNGANE